ncbi:amidohydrolase family protein [Hyphococcus formosus]|uniref:amidohydrolase n=1 Tax=Hyphococcus formosus TaxID=3143534 RepID=UPI00398B9250
MRWIIAAIVAVLLVIIGWRFVPERDEIVIYSAKGVVTVNGPDTIAEAVAVQNGRILGVGARQTLTANYPDARIDETFAGKFIVPGFIDPHIHMVLSSLQYAVPTAPPWPMATPDGMRDGYPTREAFFARVRAVEAEAKPGEPLVIYGFHDLVHGPLDRHDLDAVTTDRPLIIWHYSSHDFYLNSAALEWAKIDASLHEKFEGVPLGEDGLPTGRVFEDAVPHLLETLGGVLMNPFKVKKGLDGFSKLLREGGVTTVADLGYGAFGLGLEDLNIKVNWQSPAHSGYRLYLVPEHRAFEKKFGDKRVETIKDMVSGARGTPAPVLPQVKFFADAAFYSQTMRVSEPGYLAGQSEGSQGLWVIKPDELTSVISPYWDAGLSVRIHSNGDEAQSATLAALAALRNRNQDLRFVIEHGGLFSPDHVAKAGAFGAAVSAASHYVYYLGEAYQAPLGPERGQWISPLASLSAAGVPVTLHSDAPLAPPLPLLAASVHMTRATREGGVLTPSEKMSAYEALEAITIDAAYALGLEDELGSIAPGKRADFTILSENPLVVPGAEWPNIGVWGVVLGGEKRPVSGAEN